MSDIYNKHNDEIQHIAENFFEKQNNNLMEQFTIVSKIGRTDKGNEGNDFGVTGYRFVEKEMPMPDLNWLYDKPETIWKASVHEAVRGGIEVKGEDFNQYLIWRDHKFPDSDTLGFPIWKNERREKYGYLYDMFFPEKRDRWTAKPIALIRALILNNEPYAVIAFERFEDLQTKLIELADKLGVNLRKAEDWKKIPLNDRTWKPRNANFNLAGPMWRVPFEELAPLMTVTMVGEEIDCEKLARDYRLNLSTLQRRYGRLKEAAHGRHVDKDAVGELDETSIIAQITKLKIAAYFEEHPLKKEETLREFKN